MKKIFAFLLVAAMLVSIFAVAPAAADENIALGCKYDAKGFGITDEWGTSDYTADLTDGKANNEIAYDNTWFAFCTSEGVNGLNTKNGIGAVTIDLGSSKSFKSIKVNTFVGNESGIRAPKSMTAYVSDKATSGFTKLGTFDWGTAANNVAWAILNASGSGRYVKVEVELDGTFAFINEIEIYNTKANDKIEELPDVPPAESGYDTTGNVALNKKYDAQGYKVAEGDWPADYTADLTDGFAAQAVAFTNEWFAFCVSAGDNGLNTKDGVGSVTIDLEKAYDITSIKVCTAVGKDIEGSGVNGASKITAYVSDSAKGSFKKLGDLKIGKGNETNVAWAELSAKATGRFVKIEVTVDGTFAFINEIAVYGAEASSDNTSSEAPSTSEDTSTEAPSTSEDTSEAPSTSEDTSEAPSTSEDASTEAPSTSEDASTDAPSEENKPEEKPVEITNVAIGKDYDAKGYKTGGEWPADYTAGLTDGKVASALTFDNNWFAFCTSEGDNGLNTKDGIGSVTIDLEDVYDISSIKVNTAVGTNIEGAGVNTASKITAYVSDDNNTFTKIGDLEIGKANDAYVAWAELLANATGRYVKIEVTLDGLFAFIDEIEVYGAEAGSIERPTADQPTGDQPTGDQPSDDQTDVPAGDASSMIFFAIIALIAIAGSAVVIKTRK